MEMLHRLEEDDSQLMGGPDTHNLEERLAGLDLG
jgi:hypothetical protein